MIVVGTSPSTSTELDVDAVVVAVRDEADSVVLHADPTVVPTEVADELGRLLTAVGAGTGAGQTTVIPSPSAFTARVVIATGLGPERHDLGSGEVLRRAAGAAARAARKYSSVGYAVPAADAAEAGAIAEGALLGSYTYNDFRATTPSPTKTTHVILLGASDADLGAAGIVARAVAECRDLVNTPPGHLRPSTFASRVASAAGEHDLELTVIDAEQLSADKSGGILGVGQGSSDPPCLIRIAYRHPDATKHLALVGKGITFDSGGLSLKTPSGMITMKCDMSGAGAVACALVAIAQLAPAINVTGWLAVAENMPSGTAQRPGDIITMYGGKTVEVLNTDAEGRLVLGDALVRAAEEKPDAIIDIATLTGAQMVALGMHTAGVMGNHDGLRAAICEAAAAVGGTDVADALAAGTAGDHRFAHRGHRQRRRPQQRWNARRRSVPQGVRPVRDALGTHRHRRPGVQRRGSARVHAEGRHRFRGAHVGRDCAGDGSGFIAPAIPRQSPVAMVG